MQLNEGKACDAILRHLEGRQGAVRSNLRRPEDERHAAPVELVCNIGDQLFAIEHTAIEPFAGLLQLNNQADQHFRPMEEAVAGVVPHDELYELHLPTTALQGRRGREVRQIQDALVSWIKQTAPTIPKRRSFDHKRPPLPSDVPNVPFQVRLYRFESAVPLAGRLQIRPVVSGDREAMRDKRIRQACDSKFGKLAAWKTEAGARTILLLENPDIQLTNPSVVADTFLSIVKGRSNRPDETYLIDTCANGQWFLWPILLDEKTYYDLGQDEYPLVWQLDPSVLVAVTKR